MSGYKDGNISDDSKVYKSFPALLSFPFNEYDIEFEKGEDFARNSGIDPIIISEAGNIVAPEFLIFNHTGNNTTIALSFYTYDISFIIDNSWKIKKLDSVREFLDDGLNATEITKKIDSIKKGEVFLKKIGSSLTIGRAFDKILDELITVGRHDISKKNIEKIKSMSGTIKDDTFRVAENKTIRSFYNIHLHHIKILLGVVIASKIH